MAFKTSLNGLRVHPDGSVEQVELETFLNPGADDLMTEEQWRDSLWSAEEPHHKTIVPDLEDDTPYPSYSVDFGVDDLPEGMIDYATQMAVSREEPVTIQLHWSSQHELDGTYEEHIEENPPFRLINDEGNVVGDLLFRMNGDITGEYGAWNKDEAGRLSSFRPVVEGEELTREMDISGSEPSQVDLDAEALIDGLHIAYVEALTLRNDNGLWSEEHDSLSSEIDNTLALIDNEIGNLSPEQGLHLARSAFNKIREFAADIDELPDRLIGGPGTAYSERMAELDSGMSELENALGIADVDRTSFGQTFDQQAPQNDSPEKFQP